MIHIKTLDLRKPIYQDYFYRDVQQNESINSIVPGNIFNDINIFVGENNSGKSRLIRRIFANQDYSTFIDSDRSKQKILHENISRLIDLTNASIPGSPMGGNSTKYCDYIGLSTIGMIKSLRPFKDMYFEKILHLRTLLDILITCKQVMTTKLDTESHHNVVYEKSQEIFELVNRTICVIENYIDTSCLHARYIPIVRGLKPLDRDLSENKNEWIYSNLFLERVYFEYFKDYEKPELKSMIFTGQNLYELIKNKLLGIKSDRDLINDYEKYLGENFFEGKEVSLYPNDESKIVLIKIGDEEERPIHNLGDGIQTIIILTYEMFIHKNYNMVFFIDEPEVHLHPKYQRRLIETFKKEEFKNFQFFITTHSNHFLDLVFDYSGINIFTISNSNNYYNKTFLIEKELDDSYRPYELLGVRSSSLLLSNCTIWIEGISDKIYINKYLELFQKHNYHNEVFREDIHFTYIEYGGNNITHWDFLDEDGLNSSAITKKIFVIADNDFTTSQKKLARQSKLKSVLGKNFCLLNVREIENTLSAKVLKLALREYLSNYPNEIIFSSYFSDENKYAEARLGQYIDTYLNLPRKMSSTYGSIRDKHKFSKIAVGCINDYNDLSEEAKRIAQEVFDFIKTSN